MKSSIVAAVMAPAVASAQWWAGAPSCAQNCLSSAWANGTSTSAYWPLQTDYCASNKGPSVGSCVSSSCSATPTAYSSYSSLSSSLCSQWSSCTSAGSTGVQTITIPPGSVSWGAPGGWPTGGPDQGWGGRGGGGGGGGGPGGWGFGPSDGDDYSIWSQWASAYSGSKTWSGGVVTVTGCHANGSPWYVGPGCGWNDRGGYDGWVGWGAGWSQGPTTTATVTYTTTRSGGAVSTYTGLATYAAAVSGDLTTTQTIGGAATATGTPNAAAPRMLGGGGDGGLVTSMMALGLGAVVGVAVML